MSDSTQAIRDALATMFEGYPKPGDGWYRWDKACFPKSIAALLAELDAAQAGIDAATLAERERCAVSVETAAALPSASAAERLFGQFCADEIREVKP